MPHPRPHLLIIDALNLIRRLHAVQAQQALTPAQALIATRGTDSVEQTPLKRLGQPSEIASVIAFLCSNGSSFMTGEVLHVNGGLYIAG